MVVVAGSVVVVVVDVEAVAGGRMTAGAVVEGVRGAIVDVDDELLTAGVLVLGTGRARRRATCSLYSGPRPVGSRRTARAPSASVPRSPGWMGL